MGLTHAKLCEESLPCAKRAFSLQKIPGSKYTHSCKSLTNDVNLTYSTVPNLQFIMGIAGSVLDDETVFPASKRSPLQGSKVAAPSSSACSQFPVTLGFWAENTLTLPPQFYLRIAYESLDFIHIDSGVPLVQFPFQNILCWGSSPQNFQFKVFDLELVKSSKNKETEGVLITLKTNQGKMIEDATMSTVRRLMEDINTRAISKGEFDLLLASVLDSDGLLKDDWMHIIDQFTSSGRQFLAKQGVELLQRIGQQAPFEKFDLTCLIYDRMLNKNSINMLINTFDDPQERENLALRLRVSLAASAKTEARSHHSAQSP